MNNSTIHYSNEMLMSREWPSFFANLAKSHQGRLVAIEQDGDLLLDNPPAEGVSLQGVELRSSHKQYVLVITTAAQTYTIEAPNLIWAVRDQYQALVAVEIVDAHERKLIVRFVS
jgi:hypothetical protein